jgi:hypothetical protein
MSINIFFKKAVFLHYEHKLFNEADFVTLESGITKDLQRLPNLKFVSKIAMIFTGLKMKIRALKVQITS